MNEEIRDALGLCRAMWRAERDSVRPSSERLVTLELAGRYLTKAHYLAQFPGNTDAIRVAQHALDTLVSCVGTYDTLLPIVEAARRAVTGMPVPGIRGQREER